MSESDPAGELDPPYLSPDCRGVDHSKCIGAAWNLVTDELTTCGCMCGCYYRNWELGKGNNHEAPPGAKEWKP